MVSVGGRYEGNGTEFLTDLFRNEPFKREFFQIKSESLCNIVSDGIAAAEDLESVQPEAGALVLHVNGRDTKLTGQM